MDGRETSRCSSGGGDGIQAPGAPRTRLIPGAVAIALAAGLGAWAALAAERASWLPAMLAAAGVAVLAMALAGRRPAPIAWSLALLGGAYVVRLVLDGGDVDTLAPLEAAGLLLVAELAYDGLERPVARVPANLVARRLALVAALAAGTVVLGVVILAIAAIPLGGGVALTAVGVVSAAVAFAVLARLARRHEP